MTVTESQSRITSLDLLRGIAVLLMVQQHTGYWFWQSGGSIGSLITKYPFMVILNGLGGLAAPLFIALAGAGTSLSFSAEKSDRVIVLRGILLIVFGYILNIMTPAWFAPWSWYVLHLIGFGMCLSPLMRKANSTMLFIITLIIIASSVALLTYSGMPRYFSNNFMRGSCSAAGILKLAAFSGNFPVFPWIALFFGGMIAGRWICSGRYINILKTACAVLLIAALLFLIKQGNFALFSNAWGSRLLMVNLYMYPAYPVQFMALSAVSLLLIYLLLIAGNKYSISPGHIVVLLGRVSLTIFIIHIAVIRNVMIVSGLWQSFSAPVTLLLQAAVIAVIMFLVHFWNRVEFRYGFEWIMRKI